MTSTRAGVLVPILRTQEISSKNPPLLLKTYDSEIEIPQNSRVILNLRTQIVEHHKGQISFPGGSFEPENDKTLLDTALRETHEEMGVHPNLIQVVAELPQIPTASSRFLISPFVGILEQEPTYLLNENEIEKIIEVPLSHFLDTQNIREEILEHNQMRIKMKAYFFESHRIWGATAMILQTLLEKYLTSPSQRR